MTMLPPDPLFVAHGTQPVTSLAFSEDLAYLFFGNLDGTVNKWCVEEYRSKSQFSSSSESITSLHCMGSNLLVQDKIGNLTLWCETSDGWTRSWTQSTDYLGFCSARVIDKILVTPLSSGRLQVLDASTGVNICEAALWKREVSGEVMALELFIKNCEYYIIVCSEKGDITLWRMRYANDNSKISESKSQNIPREELNKSQIEGSKSIETEDLGIKINLKLNDSVNSCNAVEDTRAASIDKINDTTSDICNVAGDTIAKECKSSLNLINYTKSENFCDNKAGKCAVDGCEVEVDESRHLTLATLESVGCALSIEECALTLAFDPVRMRGVAGGPTNVLTVFSVSLEGVKKVKDVKMPSRGIGALAIRSDSRILAVGCWDGTLRLLSWKNLLPLAVLNTHDDSIQCLAYTTRALFLLAAGCKDGKISLWNLYNNTS